MEQQALGGRIGSLEALSERVRGWESRRNQTAVKINWQFNCGKARQKVHRFYPKLS